MDAQQVFDHTLHFLRKQGVGSKAPVEWEGETSKACYYRGPNGTQCALGCHIRDDEFSEVMEGQFVGGLIRAKLLPFRLIPHVPLLSKLQDAHDSYMPFNKGESLAAWEIFMKQIASDEDLVYTPPNPVTEGA